MVTCIQLSLWDEGAPAPSVPQVERPAARVDIPEVRPSVSVEDFFYYDDYYKAAVRQGIISEVRQGDWCRSCRLRMACDRDICSRGMVIDVNK